MRLLLDTHIAYWLAADRGELSQSEWALLNDDSNDLFVAAVSIWELRIKWNKFYASGTRKGPIEPSAALEVFRQLGLSIVPLAAEVAVAPLSAPLMHSDPFDELLLVHAQELKMQLLTRDRRLVGHPLALAV